MCGCRSLLSGAGAWPWEQMWDWMGPQSYVRDLTPGPGTVTLSGERVFADVIKDPEMIVGYPGVCVEGCWVH